MSQKLNKEIPRYDARAGSCDQAVQASILAVGQNHVATEKIECLGQYLGAVSLTATVTDTATGYTSTIPTGGVTFTDTVGGLSATFSGRA